ncbi:hypothetical protein SAMN05660666_01335 [Novosphingobium aromaticivorans]|uniref:hypothetical protein n=1 Tax=Novosphingobium aromaticivorans TaxID=48935 RepID=UPI00005DFCDD|nr:hypothetical protein [Novosphingobium aromaticivorans]SCY29747.1 hypothetical protein SAMN05660666_01335 [Novosphingobium aromaticivorans]
MRFAAPWRTHPIAEEVLPAMQSTISGILHKPGDPHFLNPALMAPNAFEIDIPHDLIAELAPLTAETQGMRENRAQYRLSNGVSLFNERPLAWQSDICWLSHADEEAFHWFDAIYHRLGLGPLVAPFVPHDREIRLYAGFLVTRSHCTGLNMHCDWSTDDNLAFTLMAPLTVAGERLGMTYRTIRDEERELSYKLGRGLVFGTKFVHSTAIGQLDERAAFLCLNFGTDRMEHWDSIGSTTARQCNVLRQPDGTFTTQAQWRARYGDRKAY